MSACPSAYCALDFGTSNSALAFVHDGALTLARLEGDATGMPTAVFYAAEDGSRLYGRTAIQAYVDGSDGRLMRSIKSILGSDLMDETTEFAPGRSVRYIDVVASYLRHLREVGQRQAGHELARAVIGRPVFFVDGDAQRDRKAQDTLAAAARAAGFSDIGFQYEPIAAALDYEAKMTRQQALVLVADIGGGTSDFSIVRASRRRHLAADRREDVLANHGVHVAGTDFDRALNLAVLMPLLGFRSRGPRGREVPGGIYFDLATWHLINTTYAPLRLAQLRQMRPMYADMHLYNRLMHVLRHRLGHLLAGRAEAAKIDVALHGHTSVPLNEVEPQLAVAVDAAQQAAALADWIARIVRAADETCAQAGLARSDIEALYFTGGSTGLPALTEALAARFPQAEKVAGERFASVVQGLAITAQRRHGATRP